MKGLLSAEESRRPEFSAAHGPILEEAPGQNGVNGNLPQTFVCPQSHDELVEITSGISILDLPTVVSVSVIKS